MAYAVGTRADGAIIMSDGSVRLPMSSSTNNQAANYRLPASSNNTARNAIGNTFYANTPQGSVLGASDNGGNGGNGGGNPSGEEQKPDTGYFENLKKIAQERYNQGLANAENERNRVVDLVSEILGGLDKRRGQFKQDWNTASDDVLNRYESERGNLQRSAQGEATRLGNAMRALGINGSAMLNSNAKQSQENLRALGGLTLERETNDRANQRTLDNNMEWALGEEKNANRMKGDAEFNYGQAKNLNWFDLLGNANEIDRSMTNYLQNIQAQNAALQAAKGGIGSYASNPMATNIGSYEDALGGGNLGIQNGQADNANVNIKNPSFFEELYKKGLLGGSYVS